MRTGVLLLGALLLVNGSAFAQPDFLIGPPPPGTTTIPVPFFGGASNVAGFFLDIHVTDPSEVNLIGINVVHPFADPTLFGAIPGTIIPSSSVFFTAWMPIPQPTNSGISVLLTTTAFDVTVQLLGTNTGENGDTDFTIFAGPIFHTVTSPTVFPGQFYWTGRAQPRQTATTTMVVPLARFLTSGSTFAAFGVEHAIPEPASVALMGGGLLCLAIGLRIRRRRKQGA
ncbi:MAG: PEP-CTERM sorting domain-containing protein [bacterium]|nr:PEP-CTERM sorting domain-containing protein [bacterium]